MGAGTRAVLTCGFGFPTGVKGPLDLTAVTFIDAASKALLTLMAEHGVELIAVGCMTKAIVEDII